MTGLKSFDRSHMIVKLSYSRANGIGDHLEVNISHSRGASGKFIFLHPSGTHVAAFLSFPVGALPDERDFPKKIQD